MDDGEQQENGRHRIDVPKGLNNVMSHQHIFIMSSTINKICVERDAAIEERNRAVSEKNAALNERDAAIRQRDAAIAERHNATKERDNALAAFKFQKNSMNTFSGGIQHGTKCMQYLANSSTQAAFNMRELNITNVFPTAIASDTAKPHQVKRTMQNKNVMLKSSKSPAKRKKVAEDLNKHANADVSKMDWDAQNIGLMNHVSLHDSNLPSPVCSCTGVLRQCYKWSNGGWQSSCCTNTISLYPLPRLPNKRHARIGGRKMSGSVFTRVLSRLAATGHDLSVPVDLKNYWAKHGTNRYITIK